MDLEEKQKCSNLLNSIGNLTLTSYNSEYSNHNFESKKKKMIQKDEPKFNEYLTNVNEWNSKEIIKRAEWLFDEYVDKIWSFNYTDKSNKYNAKNKIDEANESFKRKECFDKNKSYFKNHIFNYDVICLFLKSYFEKGLNLVQTENEILKTSYKGWVTKSIIDYLILDKKNIDINKWIDNNKNLIDEFVDDINNS